MSVQSQVLEGEETVNKDTMLAIYQKDRPARAHENSSRILSRIKSVIPTGTTRLHRFSDCVRAEKMAWWIPSKASRGERAAFRRKDMQLRYKAYAETYGDTIAWDGGWNDIVPHSEGSLSLTPWWWRYPKICCNDANSLWMEDHSDIRSNMADRNHLASQSSSVAIEIPKALTTTSIAIALNAGETSHRIFITSFSQLTSPVDTQMEWTLLTSTRRMML